MTTFLILLGIYVVWTIVGLVFFFNTMGDKFRKERWYDLPLMLPVMPIANIIGWMNRR
jgi:low temperature requirement protein LtrA